MLNAIRLAMLEETERDFTRLGRGERLFRDHLPQSLFLPYYDAASGFVNYHLKETFRLLIDLFPVAHPLWRAVFIDGNWRLVNMGICVTASDAAQLGIQLPEAMKIHAAECCCALHQFEQNDLEGIGACMPLGEHSASEFNRLFEREGAAHCGKMYLKVIYTTGVGPKRENMVKIYWPSA